VKLIHVKSLFGHILGRQSKRRISHNYILEQKNNRMGFFLYVSFLLSQSIPALLLPFSFEIILDICNFLHGRLSHEKRDDHFRVCFLNMHCQIYKNFLKLYRLSGKTMISELFDEVNLEPINLSTFDIPKKKLVQNFPFEFASLKNAFTITGF
jgi:hypothetical protein